MRRGVGEEPHRAGEHGVQRHGAGAAGAAVMGSKLQLVGTRARCDRTQRDVINTAWRSAGSFANVVEDEELRLIMRHRHMGEPRTALREPPCAYVPLERQEKKHAHACSKNL